MPMFAVPFKRSEEWNEFRRRADERLRVVEPKLGSRERHRLRYSRFYPPEQRATIPAYAAAIRICVAWREKYVATYAVSRSTRPSPTRLCAGPIASASQPNPDMPTIAAAIEPVLNVVSTRPIRC